MFDVPEIEIVPRNGSFQVICNHAHCPDSVDDSEWRDEAIDMALSHQQWHEDGMPQ